MKTRLCALLFFAGGIAWAWGQVGEGGWDEYFPEKTIQPRGAHAVYKDSGGIESFTIGRGDERCEARIHNDYKTGINQFEGYVRVTAGQGTSVHQVFKFLMIVAYPQNGGEFHQHSQTFLANNVFGKWVRVNTIHKVSEHKAYVYLDGELKTVMTDHAWSSPDGWYNKYGVYNTNDGSHSEWRNIRYFKPGDGPPIGSGVISPLRRDEGRERIREGVAIYDLTGKRLWARPGKAGVAAGVYLPGR